MNWLTAILGKIFNPTAVATLDSARTLLAKVSAGAEKIGSLFTTAGLDADALLEKGPTALKDHIAELQATAKAEGIVEGSAQATAKVTQLETDLAAQQQEVVTLKATHTTQFASFVTTTTSALAAGGIKIDLKEGQAVAADITTAATNAIALKGRELLAKHGIKDPIAIAPAASPASAKKIDASLTGLDRVRAALKAEKQGQ